MELNLERMEFARGASTITQQLAKNLYLSPRKDPLRKFRELLLARDLEAALSKRRILELYLNVIEWGDGIYGAEAASRAYFGEPASALSAEQAALLAGAIINPHLFNPGAPNRRLLSPTPTAGRAPSGRLGICRGVRHCSLRSIVWTARSRSSRRRSR